MNNYYPFLWTLKSHENKNLVLMTIYQLLLSPSPRKEEGVKKCNA